MCVEWVERIWQLYRNRILELYLNKTGLPFDPRYADHDQYEMQYERQMQERIDEKGWDGKFIQMFDL